MILSTASHEPNKLHHFIHETPSAAQFIRAGGEEHDVIAELITTLQSTLPSLRK